MTGARLIVMDRGLKWCRPREAARSQWQYYIRVAYYIMVEIGVDDRLETRVQPGTVLSWPLISPSCVRLRLSRNRQLALPHIIALSWCSRRH